EPCASPHSLSNLSAGEHTITVTGRDSANRSVTVSSGFTVNPSLDPGPITQLSGCWEHSCVVLANGKVRCWGNYYRARLGYVLGFQNQDIYLGDDELPLTLGDVDVGAPVTQVAAGAEHTCALLGTGKVRCWGYGYYGVLGYGNTDDIGDDEAPASAGDVNVGGSVAQLVAGGAHTCARLTNGSVRCWGSNSVGQLGRPAGSPYVGDDESPASVPPVNLPAAALQIAAGISHTCALLSTGNVRCWGVNWQAQLGYPDVYAQSNPSPGGGEVYDPSAVGDVNIGGPVVQISAGQGHTCALLTTGKVRCWGDNFFGKLGYGHTAMIGDDEQPAAAGDVNVGGTVWRIFAGPQHTCAVLSTGNLRCWGYNAFGQLGYGRGIADIGDNETPAGAGDVDVGGPVAQVSMGYDRTCALLTSGSVRCWGSGRALGYGALVTIGDDEPPSRAGDIYIK
ncbi:MAG TPA: hypothetical protein VK524_03690, partial [Polyangiaceae bacterium]|nr:hypothetical protein [Polyangiaceae bacterium]